METVQYGGVAFNVWDLGGQAKIRPLWRHYYPTTQGLIFVVDSGDADRLAEAREELAAALAPEEIRGVPLLVYANKQDLPNSMPIEAVAKELALQSIRGRQWFLQFAVATEGAGIMEGLDWMSRAIV